MVSWGKRSPETEVRNITSIWYLMKKKSAGGCRRLKDVLLDVWYKWSNNPWAADRQHLLSIKLHVWVMGRRAGPWESTKSKESFLHRRLMETQLSEMPNRISTSSSKSMAYGLPIPQTYDVQSLKSQLASDITAAKDWLPAAVCWGSRLSTSLQHYAFRTFCIDHSVEWLS